MTDYTQAIFANTATLTKATTIAAAAEAAAAGAGVLAAKP
jgi:hypothetical protein